MVLKITRILSSQEASTQSFPTPMIAFIHNDSLLESRAHDTRVRRREEDDEEEDEEEISWGCAAEMNVVALTRASLSSLSLLHFNWYVFITTLYCMLLKLDEG